MTCGRVILAGVAVTCLTVLTGCATTPARTDAAVGEALPGVSRPYAIAIKHEVRPYRKTYRDRRERALREIARASDDLKIATASWGEAPTLADDDTTATIRLSTDSSELAAALDDLRTAAEARDMAGLRASYARARAAYEALAASRAAP